MNAMKRLWAWWKRVAAKIAHVQGHILLSLIYIVVVTPVALLFKLVGQDPLDLKTKKRSTYWTPRLPINSVEEFLKKEY